MRARSFINRVALVVLLSSLVACSPKPRQVLYEIDFSQQSLPPFIEKIEGFSSREDWGRWTDANVAPEARIVFKQSLPRDFALVIKGQSMPKPGYEESRIKIGDFEQSFYVEGVGGVATIHVRLSEDSSEIRIIPMSPASPKELGLNQDVRKLGLGVMKIYIESYIE